MIIDNIENKALIENITIENVEYSNIYILEKGIICETNEFDDFNITSSIRNMALKLNLDYSYFLIIQRREDKLFRLFLNGSKELIEDLDSLILSINENEDVEELQIDYIESDIKTLNNKKQIRIKTYPDGKTFFRNNNGTWVQASEEDSITAFKRLLFGGPIGIHKLFEGKYIDFLLFFCTAGLFSLGYIEEIVPFWFDCKKDKEGRYYIPLDSETKKMFVIPQILMVLGNLALCAFYFFLLRTFI